MNGLDLLRSMRADVPLPTQSQLAHGGARLLASIRREPCAASRRRTMLAAGAVAVAAAIAVVAILAPGTRSAVPRAALPKMTLTARLLRTAAATVARQAAARPSPNQWFYTRFVEYAYGQGTSSDENWVTFNGRWTAYFVYRRLIVHKQLGCFCGGGPTALGKYNTYATPLTAYNALASLPSEPRVLLAVIARQVAEVGAENVESGSVVSLYAQSSWGAWEFDYLAQLLWNAAMSEPPRAEAAVFRAMAAIPGVSIQRGITDVTGRPVVGLSANGGKTQLLLDARTYQVIGMRAISTGQNPVRLAKTGRPPKGRWPATGAVWESMAWAQVTMVSGPGRR